MKKNNKGFTLAELLVAVALIGILVSVSIVIFTGRIAEAKETVCKNEKATMKHGTVIISMTEQVDWAAQFGTGGVNSPSSESIISYLLTEGYIEKFRCPSGGTIYAAEVKSDMVTFRCTYHDDGMEPGEENASNKAAKDLADAVNKFVKDKYGNNVESNTPTIRKFLEDEKNLKYMIAGNVSGILTDTVIDKIVEEMEIIKRDQGLPFDKEKYRESLVKLREQTLVLVPYFVPKANGVITYYTTESDYSGKFGTSATCHAPTSIICYNGIWYFSTNTNEAGTKVSADWIPTGFNTIDNIQKRFDDLILSKNLIII